MLRNFALIMLFALSSPASAMCWNSAESASPPRLVAICYKGKCVETKLVTQCASVDEAFWVYENGWSFHLEDGIKTSYAMSPNGKKIANMKVMSCYSADDPDACPGTIVFTQ